MRRFLFLYLFIIYSSFSNASTFVVNDDHSMTVLIGKKEYYLNKGDRVEIGEPSGWSRKVKIIATTNPEITSQDALVGNIRYGELLDKKIISGGSQNQSSSYIAKGNIEIITSDNKKVFLFPGDTFSIGTLNGWKREIKVTHSAGGLKTGEVYFIGDKTLSEYTKSNTVLIKDPRVANGLDAPDDMDRFIQNLFANVRTIDDEESEESDSAELTTECPPGGKTIKLNKSISIVAQKGKEDQLPEGTVVTIQKMDKGACQIRVEKLPKDSTLSLRDFPSVAKTYPNNLNHNNFEEYDLKKSIPLEKGSTFKLPEGVNIRAIGRKSGKVYKMNGNDTLIITGVHSNGDYIVKKKGEKHEYRIDPTELDELNDSGFLELNTLDSVNNTLSIATNEVNEPDFCASCAGSEEQENDVPMIEDDESWESCRSSDIKSRNGKILRANDYIDDLFNISNSQANNYLSDPETKNLAVCIGRSMGHGTARNSAPSCQKDANGNVIQKPIRRSIKNSSGKHVRWELLNSAPKACASKSTASYLADRLKEAADCLEVDPKEFLPIINHESHFQPATISPSYAMGLGQIVSVNYAEFYMGVDEAKDYIKSNHSYYQESQKHKNIDAIARNEEMPNNKKLSRTTAFMLNLFANKLKSPANKCEGLKAIYNKPFSIPDNIKKNQKQLLSYVRERENDRLCKPKNPDEGLYMSMIFYLQNKYYTKFFLENTQGIPKSKINDWSIIFSRYMYNGGTAGTLIVMQAMIRDFRAGVVQELNSKSQPTGRKLSIQSLQNMSNEEMKRYFSQYLKYKYPNKNETRRNEVANYVTGHGGKGGIDGDLRQIEKEGKGSCGKTY